MRKAQNQFVISFIRHLQGLSLLSPFISAFARISNFGICKDFLYSAFARMSTASTPASRRLIRDFKKLQVDPPAGKTINIIDDNVKFMHEALFFHWSICWAVYRLICPWLYHAPVKSAKTRVYDAAAVSVCLGVRDIVSRLCQCVCEIKIIRLTPSCKIVRNRESMSEVPFRVKMSF